MNTGRVVGIMSTVVVGAIALACAGQASQQNTTAAFATRAGLPACSAMDPLPPEGCEGTARDEFSARTTIVARIPLGDLTLHLLAVGAPGDATRALPSMEISSYHPDGWHYLECHSLDLLVDGTPARLGRSEHHGHVLSGGAVSESVDAEMDASTAEQLARAARVRGRICADVFDLDAQQLATVRSFLRDWRIVTTPGGPITTAPAPPDATAVTTDAAAR